MRIIAGSRRGMKLNSPKTDVSRPITDAVKESLFNILRSYDLPVEAKVADVFCGVGSMGLEAISRGAESVTFIEREPVILDTLKKNIAKARFEEQARVLRADAFRVGAAAGADERKYDLVFIDPPYKNTNDVGPASPLAAMLKILQHQITEKAIVVVRTHKKVEMLRRYDKLETIDTRTWGSMTVNLLREKTNDQ